MIRRAAEALCASQNDILDLKPLNQGMTNRNYTFRYRGDSYIMRIPGEGTSLLIDRTSEREAYRAIEKTGLSDELVFFADDGVKVSRFYECARTCDPQSHDDVGRCMDRLREMHGMGLCVRHSFDIFQNIESYEALRQGAPSEYPDYEAVKARVFALRPIISSVPQAYGLTHLDAVSDNFLMMEDRVLLIDWEYAAMCDQHMDIAMFAIYSAYDWEQVVWLTNQYFGGTATPETHMKIACYLAAAGLLWSNWCEYKRLCGVTFGSYARTQYAYAAEYSYFAQALAHGDLHAQN